MKKTRKRKLLTLLMVLVLVLTMTGGNTYAASTSKVKVKSMSVKTNTVTLPEGQALSKTLVSKCLKVAVKYSNGKINRNYTKYTIKNSGKTIKPNSKGYYKVTVVVGKLTKTVALKVNKIKKIYVKKTTQKALKEGTKFNASAFKKATTVYADYVKGTDKKLTTYTVSAPTVVKANSKGKFVVTMKYGTKKATYSIPVIKAPPTTEEPTTETPTTEEPTTEEPTTETPTTETPTTEEPTTEEPTVPVQPPGGETVPEVDWLYFYGNQYDLYPLFLDIGICAGINLPEDYDSIVEWGIIHTTDNIDNNNLIVGCPGTIRTIQSDTDRSQEWNRGFHFSQEEWDAKTPVKVRLYAIVKKGETTETVYSKVLSFTLTDE